MSLLNQLNATTTVKWLNTTPEDILNTASALVWKLMGNAVKRGNWAVQPSETVDGGKMVEVPIEYANSNSGQYGADTVISIDKVDLFDAARFGWAGVHGANTLNLDDLTQNTGGNVIVRLTDKYIDSIKKAARVQMAADVIAASTGVDYHINGLGDLFNTNTAIAYGSITEAEMANWKANVITTNAEICFEVMQKIFREPDMGGFAGALPNFCVTTQALLDGYERTLQPQQWYSDKDMVSAGWANVWHKGAPIVADKGVGSTSLYALNLNFLSLRAHEKYNFTTPVWAPVSVQKPDTITANTRFRGNLYCTNRRMHALHSNLSEPT